MAQFRVHRRRRHHRTSWVGLTRALPEHVGQAIQTDVEDTYQRSIGLVSKGRGLSPEEEKAAEGRSGPQDAKAWVWWTSSAIWMTPSGSCRAGQPQELAGHPIAPGRVCPDKFPARAVR